MRLPAGYEALGEGGPTLTMSPSEFDALIQGTTAFCESCAYWLP